MMLGWTRCPLSQAGLIRYDVPERIVLSGLFTEEPLRDLELEVISTQYANCRNGTAIPLLFSSLSQFHTGWYYVSV